MNTIEDIIEWIKDYDNPDDNIEKFTAELIQMITDMDYTASKGGAAVGYAGLIGYSAGVKLAIYFIVENLGDKSNRRYCFINAGVKFFNNSDDLIIGTNNSNRLYGGAGNDVINEMLGNIVTSTQILITRIICHKYLLWEIY